MLLVDIILFLLLLGFVGAGMKDGFVHSAGRLIGAIIGFVAAKKWYLGFAGFTGIFLPAGWGKLIAFILIFTFVTRLVGYLVKLADGAFSILSVVPFLKTINSFLGAVLGLFEGIILMGGVIYIVKITQIEPTVVQWLVGSKIAPIIQYIFQFLLAILL